MWRVATIAGRYGFMGAVVPAIKDAPHDMTIGASFRVVLEIRQPCAIIESIATQAGYASSQSSEPHQKNQRYWFKVQRTTFQFDLPVEHSNSPTSYQINAQNTSLLLEKHALDALRPSISDAKEQ